MIWNVQLVFDCADPDTVMLFWGRTLAYEGEFIWSDRAALQEWRKGFPQYDGHGRIDDGAARRMPIYIQTVPELKGSPNRLGLELGVPSGQIDRFESEMSARGAVEFDGGFRDPEGNEFSVVGTDGDEVALRTLVFDVLDPDRMLDFWARATGYAVIDGRCLPPPARIENGALVVAGERVTHPSASWALGIVNEPAKMDDRVVLDLMPAIGFRRVDEPKTMKNRLHLDLRSTEKGAELERIEALGATVQRCIEPEFYVMNDPEGNEFCLS